MNFSAEGVAAIIVALAGLISGLYNLMQARRVQALDQLDSAEKENEKLRNEKRDSDRLLEIAMRHIHALNMAMARRGLDEIPLPEALK